VRVYPVIGPNKTVIQSWQLLKLMSLSRCALLLYVGQIYKINKKEVLLQELLCLDHAIKTRMIVMSITNPAQLDRGARLPLLKQSIAPPKMNLRIRPPIISHTTHNPINVKNVMVISPFIQVIYA